MASRLVGPAGRVVAIEASPEFHRALDDTLRRNGRRNVRTVNVAAADAPGAVTLYLADPGNLGNTSVVRPREFASSFEVAALPLPDILPPGELEHARLIKIDVKGGEASLMAGLASALDRLHPDAELVIEVSPRALAKQGHSPDDVLRPLRMHGFHPYRLVNDYDPAGYRPAPPSRPAALGATTRRDERPGLLPDRRPRTCLDDVVVRPAGSRSPDSRGATALDHPDPTRRDLGYPPRVGVIRHPRGVSIACDRPRRKHMVGAISRLLTAAAPTLGHVVAAFLAAHVVATDPAARRRR